MIEWYESEKLPACVAVGVAYRSRGWAEFVRGELTQSLLSHNHAADVFAEAEGPDSLDIAMCLVNRSLVFTGMNEHEHAHRDLTNALEMQLQVLGSNHTHTILTRVFLADNERRRGNLNEALRWAEQGYDGVLRHPRLDKSHQYYARALDIYGRVLVERKDYMKAEPIARESMVYRGLHGLDPRLARQRLEDCLFHLGKYEECEALLLENLKDAKGEQAKAWQLRACNRLVQLYEAWEKPAEVAKWRDAVNLLAKEAATTDEKEVDLEI